MVLESRKAQGLHGGMQFTYRNPERSTTPSRILADATTLIVGAWPYANRPPDSRGSEEAGPQAEIAAYAWRDHYRDLRLALEAIAAPLRQAGFTARVMADDNSLVDRAAAIRAGIGWAGKNSNVLLPGAGSWYVLGAVITNAQYQPDRVIGDQCGTCRRCLDGCPTGAIVADGVVDARRCLAWLLQVEGDFPIEYREALGTRIYGCDDCQTVCPPSRNEPTGLVGDEVTSLDLFELLTASDDELIEAVGRWYIPRRDPRYVRRNALVALGNAQLSSAQEETARSLLDRFDPPDTSSVDNMLSEHARWARTQLGLS